MMRHQRSLSTAVVLIAAGLVAPSYGSAQSDDTTDEETAGASPRAQETADFFMPAGHQPTVQTAQRASVPADRRHSRSLARAGWTLTAIGLASSILFPISGCASGYQDPEYFKCGDIPGLITVNVGMLVAGIALGIPGTLENRRLSEDGVGLPPVSRRERRLQRFGWAMAIFLGALYLGGNVVTWFFSGVDPH